MTVTGTGSPLTTATACTFTDAGDLVTKTAHGLSNGDLVSFASIVTTTGVIIKTTYYVINATADTFQVSLTLGGAAINLVTNGTGTMKYDCKVVSIVANTSVTVSKPMTAAGSQTLSFRNLNTAPALLRGWTITG
jgi:hypothetical protein